jgi:hypothetical protein
MKKLYTAATNRGIASGWKTGLSLAVGLVLAASFWLASGPLVNAAAQMTPAEMIQAKLPAPKTLANAEKPEVLSAVCGAVRNWKKDAPQIVRTAAGARKEIAGDIVAEGIRCLGDRPNCDLVGQIVSAGLSANADAAAIIVEAALQLAPGCRSAIEHITGGEGEGGFTNPPSNQNAPPGSSGASGSAGLGQTKCTICHNPNNYHEIEIPCDQSDKFLADHPGDYRGPCQATPPANP